jgi:hypothetical protein
MHTDPQRTHHQYNPVTVTIKPQDTVGAVFLGILSFTLLIALIFSQRRVRQLEKTVGALAQSPQAT